MQGSITVKGSKELIATLGMFSSRVGSSLVVAIKDGLRPVVPAMRSAIIQVVGNGKKSSKHWSVSETDYKERTLKRVVRRSGPCHRLNLFAQWRLTRSI